MVLARNVVSSSNVTSGTSFATSSQSFYRGRTYLFGFSIRNGASTDPSVPTVTGGGCTWTSVGTTSLYDPSGASRRTLFLFQGVCTALTTGALTANFGAVTHTGMIYTIDELKWADTSAPIVQAAENHDSSGTATTLSVTLASFASANNATYVIFCNGNDTATTTVGSGFGKLGDVSESNAAVSGRLTSEFKTGNDTGADITYSLAADLGGIAVEIKAATAYEIATDSFTRADNTSAGMNLGSNWTGSVPDSDLGISSNKAVATGDHQDNVAFWNANSFFTDQYSQVTFSTLQSDSVSGIVVRANASDYILAQVKESIDTIESYWYNSGTYTQIGSTYSTAGFASGDVMRMEADGPNYTIYHNGIARVNGSNNSAPKKGAPGLIVSETTDAADDWSGGNLYSFGILDFTAVEESPVSGTVDLSITIPTGYSNYGLVMTTQSRDSTDSNRNITGITWNTSEAFTQADEENTDALDMTVEQWYRVAPTTGAHTASITYAGATFRTRAVLAVMAGMAQSSVVDVVAGGSGNSASPSVSITPTVDGVILFDSIYQKFEASPTPGSDQLGIDGTTVSAGADGVGTSYKRMNEAEATTMSWTSSLDDYCISAVAYKPYTSSATTYTKTFTADGIVLVQTTKTFTADGVVKAETIKTFTVDGLISEIKTKTFTIDGIVSSQTTKTFTVDGSIQATNTQTFTIDGLINGQIYKTFTADGLVINRYYSLGTLILPRPSSFSREFVPSWRDSISINGKTNRDLTGNKEKYVLSWDYLSMAEFDALFAIISLNTAVTFNINDGNLQIGDTSVLPYLSNANYETLGGSYYVATQIILTEET